MLTTRSMALVLLHRASTLLSLSAITFAGPLAQGGASDEPAAREGWHLERHNELNNRVLATKDAEILFIGDSITQSWEGAGKAVWSRHYGDRKAINLGISGDRTQHVLWRLENGNVDGIDPRVAVVMIGTNNSNGQDNTVREIARGITAIVESLRAKLPHTHVLLLDIFPRGAEPNAQRGKILQVNQIVRRLDDGEAVHYLSIGQRFLEEDGTITRAIMPDALHLTPAGYEIWAEAIEAPLERLLQAPRPAIRHSILVVGHGRPSAIIDETGEVVWSHPARASDGCLLANGNVLLALYPSTEYPGGGMLELTAEGLEVFSWKGTQKEVSTAQRLENGNTLINESGPEPRILEITPEGETVRSTPLVCQLQNAHMQTRMARRLANGNFLVPHLLDFAVKEYDASGAVLRTIPTDHRGRDIHDWPFTAIRVPGGNTLIGCTHGNRVIEVDPGNNVTWQLTNEDLGSDLIRDACGVQRLPNGNTLITSYAARDGINLFEVTPSKRVVWTWKDANTSGVHHFQVLTTNGRPLRGAPLR